MLTEIVGAIAAAAGCQLYGKLVAKSQQGVLNAAAITGVATALLSSRTDSLGQFCRGAAIGSAAVVVDKLVLFYWPEA